MPPRAGRGASQARPIPAVMLCLLMIFPSAAPRDARRSAVDRLYARPPAVAARESNRRLIPDGSVTRAARSCGAGGTSGAGLAGTPPRAGRGASQARPIPADSMLLLIDLSSARRLAGNCRFCVRAAAACRGAVRCFFYCLCLFACPALASRGGWRRSFGYIVRRLRPVMRRRVMRARAALRVARGQPRRGRSGMYGCMARRPLRARRLPTKAARRECPRRSA